MERILEILTGGGATGICIGMLFYMYYKDKEASKTITEYTKMMNEHFKRDLDVRKEETYSRLETARALSKLSVNVSNCPTNAMNKLSKKNY